MNERKAVSFVFLLMSFIILIAVGCGEDSKNDTEKPEIMENGMIWKDASTGLIWQRNPSKDSMDFSSATMYCYNLSLSGLSDWRLPTISELRTIISGCEANEINGVCGVTDLCTDWDCHEKCQSCECGKGPNLGCYFPSELKGECDWFNNFASMLIWSQTPGPEIETGWGVDFYCACIWDGFLIHKNGVRCVHD